MNRTEYLDKVGRVIVDEAGKSDDGLVRGALLGTILAQQDLHWNKFDFPRLKDLVLELASNRSIFLVTDSKGAFAISTNPDVSVSPVDSVNPTSKRLKQPVWNAFISEDLPKPRFLDRSTGAIRFGPSIPAGRDWCEITPIPATEQKQWAVEFQKTNNLEGHTRVSQSLHSPTWYREYPQVLNEISTGLRSKWNRKRSHSVVKFVQQWASENDVNIDHLIYRYCENKRQRNLGHGPEQKSTSLREILLEALAKLDTNELLELPIPPRAVLLASRSDLIYN